MDWRMKARKLFRQPYIDSDGFCVVPSVGKRLPPIAGGYPTPFPIQPSKREQQTDKLAEEYNQALRRHLWRPRKFFDLMRQVARHQAELEEQVQKLQKQLADFRESSFLKGEGRG